MAIEGAPLVGRILDPKLSKVVGKLGFAVPPAGPDGLFPPFTAQGYGINGASRHKEAAFAFLAWATDAATMKDVALSSTFLAVTRNSVWNDPDFRKKYDFDYGHGTFVDAYRATLKVAPAWYRPAFRDYRSVADRVGLALQEAVVGQRSSKDALDAAQADVVKIMQHGGYL